MTDRSNHAIIDLFVPDFCQPQAVAIIVIGAELLAFVLVIAGANSWATGIEQLAITSLYVQWAALVSAGLLCVSRHLLARLSTWQSAVIAFSIPMLVNLALTLASHLLQNQGLLSGSWTTHSSLLLDLLRNLTITAIVSGVLLRYLYLRHETAKSLAAEHQARIDALQSRIRPHFLFNSLNTIISLVRDQPVRAEELCRI
ncbi:MAG: histidine kinase [Immundisolibacteraceae bacterium]|nr:histidine kinase [Immundisolibacteraceae bacterium]